MTKKSKLKKLLVLVVALIAISVSILIVNAAQTDKQVNDIQNQTEVTDTVSDSNISTYFHEASGTLIVSGQGEVEFLYPRNSIGWEIGCGEYVVEVDTTIKHLIIEEGITSLYNSFNDLHNLETISFPNSLNEINSSFRDCDKLTNLIFSENLIKFSNGSFEDCDSVTDIHFSAESITITEDNCCAVFSDMDSLKKVEIPHNSTVSGAFNYCKNLEKVVLGSSVHLGERFSRDGLYVGYGCFYNCNENIVVVTDKNDWLEYSERDIFTYHSTVPERIEATNEDVGIRLDWDAKYYANTYHIYRKAKGESNWTMIADTKTNRYLDKTAKSGKTYTYMLKTDDNSESVTVEKTFIATPELVNAYNTTTNTVKIKWNKVDGAVKYRVYRSAYDMHGNRTWERLGDTTTNIFEDKTTKSHERYCYTVRAFGKSEYSGYDSEGVSVIFLRMPKVTSVSNAVDGIKVTVNSPEGGADVYRKTTGGNWDFIGYTSSSVFVDKTAKSGVTYTYTARKNSFDNRDDTWHRSAYDTKGKTITYLETPELSSATSTKSGVKLQWDKVAGASGYKIYRKTGNSGWGEAIATVKGNSVVTYVDKTAKKGVTYTYTVRAYNGSTKSGYIAAGKTVKDKY